ncbi:MFS transporter [Leptothoe sp. PORK10 BA2]|uniref:MFS transporter n=1 Tax=Leptothoe sp. PORK10 BA2 TaxID=3110254 RepID=UPI002B21A25E|nr:MFS transporter [Leptothoe sp. PORK10 BA2]MEA5462831.1 MFS transporter [Leptothoe sp. PORK10 BA2]
MLRESDSSTSKSSSGSDHRSDAGLGTNLVTDKPGRSAVEPSEPDAPSEPGSASPGTVDNAEVNGLGGQISGPITGFWPVLQNRNFLILWGGQVFSQLADKVYLVLMIAIIASQYDTPGQTISGWVSAVMIAFTIPAVLFGSLAGVYVGRWLKQPVLVLTNVLRGALVLLLPLGLWLTQDLGSVAGIPLSFCLLLVITFLVSTLTQFFAPAEQSVIPLIVEDRHLLSANSLYTTTMMASVIIGFAVGEPLLAIADQLLVPFDGGTGLGKDLLVGLGYGLAGMILTTMGTGESAKNLTQDSHLWSDIKDGLRYIQQRPPIRNAIIQLVLLFSVFAALAVLAVRIAEVIPALKSSQFGVLLAAGGVGMGVGATLIGQLGHRFARRHLSLVGLLGMGVALGGLSLTIHSLWPTLALMAMLGVFAASVGIPMQTTVQEHTPEEMRGKVFGLQNNLVNIALSLPLAFAGVAEALVGLRSVLLSLAAIVILGGLLTQTVFTVSAETPSGS